MARLHGIPRAFDQVTANMRMGMRDRRMPPKYLLEQTLVQVRALADQKPEDSPLATPLKKFPASIAAAEQDRSRRETLAAIATDALPAYKRFAEFMEQTYIPAGRTEPGIWAIPEGGAYYSFLIRQETTLKRTPEQIHAIGLKEVARDEAEMLAIAKKLGFSDLEEFSRQPEDQSAS